MSPQDQSLYNLDWRTICDNLGLPPVSQALGDILVGAGAIVSPVAGNIEFDGNNDYYGTNYYHGDDYFSSLYAGNIFSDNGFVSVSAALGVSRYLHIGDGGFGPDGPIDLIPVEGSPAHTIEPGTPTAGGSVDPGEHSYMYTFVTAEGEGQSGGPGSAVTTDAGHGTVLLDCAAGTGLDQGSPSCIQRNIYRTEAGNAYTGPWKFLTTINNNTAGETWTDTAADSTLGAAFASVNRTVNVFRALGEYSAFGLLPSVAFVFDTTQAMSTAGTKLFSWKNAGVEKAYLDKDGNEYLAGAMLGQKDLIQTLTPTNGSTVTIVYTAGSCVVIDASLRCSFPAAPCTIVIICNH